MNSVRYAFDGVHAAEAVEKICSAQLAREAEAGAVREMAVGGEENAAVEIPDGALGAFGCLGGSFGFAGAVLDARLRSASVREEKKQGGVEKRLGEKGEH